MALVKKLSWTQHSQIKMRQYGLSKTKLISLVYKPERKEKGIVPGTTAVMKTNPIRNYVRKQTISNGASRTINYLRKAPGEVWLMYKDTKDQRKVISAWRYPGITKPGEEIPVPQDIKLEILKGSFK